MRKSYIIFLALFFSTLLHAQEGDYELSAVLGYDVAEGNIGVKNYAVAGVSVQSNTLLLPSLRPELSFLYGKAEFDESGEKSDIYRIALGFIYDLHDYSYITPYVKGGIGYENFSDAYGSANTNSLFGVVAAGGKLHLDREWSLKAEVQYMLKDNSTRWDSNAVVLVGVSYSFGREKEYVRMTQTGYIKAEQSEAKEEKKEEELFKDSDKDGVLDTKDKCPNTPEGVKIDAFGCEVDDDGDGVANSLDSCPGTRKGAKVDAKGCALDKDGDGVLNAVDKCPDTPQGVEVDANGCKIRAIIALVQGRKQKSAIIVSTQGGSVTVEKFNEVTTISDPTLPPARPKEVSPTTLAKLFPAVASSEALPPRSYTIYFDGLKIKPESQKTLQELLDDLKKRKNESIRITGYTDTVGSSEFNYRFGLKRAEVMKNIIQKADSDAAKITVRSFGESALAVPTADNVAEDKNKRVEVFVY